MDDYLTDIQNLRRESPLNPKKTSKLKELLMIILGSNPEIMLFDNTCDEEGDIKFEVSIKSLGLTYDLVKKYKAEISCDFVINFIGELLVRENIDSFVRMITGLNESYGVVNKYEHKKFGMKVVGDTKFLFTFHSSLLQSILTEDFKKVK